MLIEARGDLWLASAGSNAAPPTKPHRNQRRVRARGVSQPDGRSVAYWSDATGEYQLYVRDVARSTPVGPLTHFAHGFRFRPVWSPDSRRIAYADQRGAIVVFDVAARRMTPADTEPVGGGDRTRVVGGLEVAGLHASAQALKGIESLKQEVDTLIIIPNDRLLQVAERTTSMLDAFKLADQVLLQGVQGITDLITIPGLINLDFADVRATMREAGTALMGIGQARGEDRAVAAAKEAISSPLLEASVDGARGVLLNISGGSDLGLFEVNEAAEVIASAAHQDANIIFGAVIDDALGDEVRVTVIAAGFDRTAEQANAENGRPQSAGAASPAEDESVWPTPGRRPGENRVTRPAPAPAGQAERREPEPREPERREPERRPRYDGDDDELDIPSFLKR